MKSSFTRGISILFLFFFVQIKAQVSYQEAFPNISFNFPVEIQHSNDGSNRLFVVEQPGTIKVFPNRSDASSNDVTNFLDIAQKISYNAGQEIGLLGLAFHPNFSSNRYLYVYYIDRPNNYRINIVRYQVSATNSNSVDTSTETIIFQAEKNQTNSNHNGGKIGFGPDGYLYISIGDGGGGGDPQGNAQNLNTAFGSILRIDVDLNGDNPIEANPELPNGNYEIPSNNPRVGQSGLDEIYAWGIRNTWKFSFDQNGNLWGADVGQNAFEEINIINSGGNYGWNRFEGNSDFRTNASLITAPDRKPIFTYGHSNGDKSITGGYVYNGSLTSASLQGKYIYGDFLTGRVWALTYNSSNGTASAELLFRASGESISSFGEDESGELYFSGYGANVKLFILTETVSGPVTTAVNGIGEWLNLNNGTNGTVRAIALSNDNSKYVGGNFSRAGEIDVSNLAIISPENQWQTFGTGSNGVINAIEVAPNGNVFVGGLFSEIGGITANNIAFWNGSNWAPMDLGTNGEVTTLKIGQNNTLYVGGVFSTANDITVNNIALWQNNTWSALTDNTTGVSGTNNEIRSLAIDTNNNLYVGGNFDTAGGVAASRIARWNGNNWTALGSGTSGFVQAIEIAEGFLYAGGNFNLAGNATVNRIARWNLTSATWEALGNGLSGSVNALAWDGTYIYAGGDFETASNIENNNLIVNNIARWNTSEGWQALGTGTQVGVTNSINTLAYAEANNELAVGGTFNASGAIQTNNISLWSELFCTENSIIPEYRVNGVWDDGNSTLTIDEGDTLTLSILPNGVIFTITLPNGETFPNDYDLGVVDASMSGTYKFTTEQGCTEDFDLIVNTVAGDNDNDGVTDNNDSCPNTPAGEDVNANGCSESQLDNDNDGVNNSNDLCSNTPAGETVDTNGCSASQLDDDNDGVSNANDLCPNTPANESVDSQGCSSNQQDIDNDGVSNENDLCNNTPPGENVDANGCSESQLDDDNDGVTNANDLCPNTPVGETVDTNGCTIATLPADQFAVTSKGNSCVTTANGSITIAAKTVGVYAAELKIGNDVTNYSFTDILEIEELVAGTYNLCITAQDYPNYQNCAKAIITAPVPLQVQSSLNSEIDSNSVTLKMSGGTTYSVSVNGKTIETDDSEITLFLDKEVNTIQVSSELTCKGIYEEIIALENAILAYPNPAKDYVSIDLRKIKSATVLITLYSESGAQLFSDTFNTEAGNATLQIAHLTKGIYFIRIKNEDIDKALKLIKL